MCGDGGPWGQNVVCVCVRVHPSTIQSITNRTQQRRTVDALVAAGVAVQLPAHPAVVPPPGEREGLRKGRGGVVSCHTPVVARGNAEAWIYVHTSIFMPILHNPPLHHLSTHPQAQRAGFPRRVVLPQPPLHEQAAGHLCRLCRCRCRVVYRARGKRIDPHTLYNPNNPHSHVDHNCPTHPPAAATAPPPSAHASPPDRAATPQTAPETPPPAAFPPRPWASPARAGPICPPSTARAR